MGRRLFNANISHVSYVDKAANKKKFFLAKAEGETNVHKEVKILKGEDDEQRLVYGVVYEPDVEDAHEDVMSAEEIEKAAHKFMTDYRNIDKQHSFEAGSGDLVESYVAPADFTVNGETITKGSWVITTKASEEVWESIKKGEITGYSMGGIAEVEEITKAEDDDLISKITKAVQGVMKGQVKDNFDKHRKKRDFRTAFDLFERVWWEELWKDNPEDMNVDTMREAANDFIEIIQAVVNAPNLIKALGGEEAIQKMREERDLTTVEKAGKKVSKKRLEKLKAAQAAINDALADLEEDEGEVQKSENPKGEIDVNKEELQAVLKEAMTPVVDRIEKLEGKETEQPETVTKSEDEKNEALTADVVKQLFKDELAPIEKRLETVEKARGISNGETSVEKNEGDPEDQPKDNFWNGVL